MLSQCPSFLFIVPVSVVFNKVHVTNINEICLVQYISMKWQLASSSPQIIAEFVADRCNSRNICCFDNLAFAFNSYSFCQGYMK